MTNFQYVDFVPVRSRKKRKGNHKTNSPATRLRELRVELERDEWFAECRQIVDDSLDDLKISFSDVICLGLGSPSSSRIARAQLGFLLGICDHLLIERQRISLYDPVFTEDDLTLLQELQLTVLPNNENGLYPVNVPTIVFMPHCDMELYENLLKANWKPHLDTMKLLIIANQLSEYIVNNPSGVLSSKAPCLVQIVPLLQYRALPVSKAWPTAFNNIAVQFIPSQSFKLVRDVQEIKTHS